MILTVTVETDSGRTIAPSLFFSPLAASRQLPGPGLEAVGMVVGMEGMNLAVVDGKVEGDEDDGQGEEEGEDASEGRRREEEEEEEKDRTSWFFSLFGFQEPEGYDDVKVRFEGDRHALMRICLAGESTQST